MMKFREYCEKEEEITGFQALAQKQHQLVIAQQEKEELEAKLAEAEKTTTVVQNITYNIQDSAISGDITANLNSNDNT